MKTVNTAFIAILAAVKRMTATRDFYVLSIDGHGPVACFATAEEAEAARGRLPRGSHELANVTDADGTVLAR